MRRALNVLQACHAAYDVTGETEVYNCTGNPHPSDIETIVNSMFSDEFTTAYRSKCTQFAVRCRPLLTFFFAPIIVISDLKTERGLALPDLLNGAFEFIDGLQLEPHARVYLLDQFATIEFVFFSSTFYICCLVFRN
jgi:replication factor C subunit 3/5